MDCLAKYPEARPQSAEELALRFEEALGKKIYEKGPAPARTSLSRPGVIIRKREEHRSGVNGSVGTLERHTVIVQRATVTMPESMAMLKLKGFINDLGGEIVESVPGLIRVRLGGTAKKGKGGGLFGWFGGRETATAAPAPESVIHMELVMETPDLSKPSQLFITLRLTPVGGAFSAEARSKCERIGRDFQAYLMGR